MKDFSWENLKKHASSERFNWYELNHNQPITEEQFLQACEMFRKFTKGKPKYYQPGRMKRQYTYLKETFGFFT